MRLLLILNIIFIFLVRFLIKRNIFSIYLGYFTICFQFFVAISSPFRTRATSLDLKYSYFIVLFLFVASALVLIPLILNFVLTDKKRKDLQALEEKTTMFLYNIMYDFRQKLYAKLSFYKPLEDFLTQKLTAYIWKAMFFSTGRIALIAIFFFLPWLIFIGFFYFELSSQAFFISVYVFAGWLFVMRVFSVCLFIAKNTVWEIFSHKLNKQSPELYFNTISFPAIFWQNFEFLTDLILDPTKEELFKLKQNKTWWKDLNQIIYYYYIYSIFFDFWWKVLPKIKHFPIR